ncbi:unnamed protein product [Anisakis simplex]|uniref:E2F_TDP domain-containing protein n=1 Tax=Anisakis simplex TaxID=6269 RepID=A0A0M3JQR5_ANISI|nr:unnamed protein product [Anisakis simplex]
MSTKEREKFFAAYCLDSSSLSTDLSAATTSNNTSSALSLSCSSSGVGGISPLLIARPTQPKLSRKRSRLSLDSTNTTDDNESEDGDSQNASRKEKSLGLLCQKFLIAMGEEAQSGSDVHLETVAKKMTVEKRRIYDIVNVMEALEAMSKTNKSFYRWHGLDELPQLMALLQQQALSEGLPERIHRVERAMCSFTELSPASKRSGADIVGTLVSNKTTLNDSGCYFGVGLSSNNNNNNEEDCDSENDPRLESLSKAAQKSENRVLIKKFGSENNLSNPTSTSTKNSQQITRDRNAKNSLAQLCRRFLMVLLCNPKDRRRVSLDVASTVLIKDADSEGFEPPSRSRCRRLYDIANVLVAMGIIKKVHYLFGTKKIPLFVYCGPEPDGEFSANNIHYFLTKFVLNSTKNQQRQQSAANQVEIARQKCDFDILVAASEQERRRLQEAISFGVATSSSKGCLAKRGPSQSRDLKSSEISHSILQSSSSSPVSASRSQISFSDSEMINDENIPPLIGFAASHTNLMLSPKSTASGVVPLVRTPSGAILVKPKAQEGGASASQSALAASAVIHRPDSVMSSAISTRSPFIAFNPIQPNSSGFHSQIHPSAIHHQIQHTAAAAAYSMSAILGTVNRVPPNAATMPQCHYRILSSPFHQPQHNDILKPLQTITAFE